MLPTGFRTFHFISFIYVFFSFVSFLFSQFCFRFFFAFRYFFVSFRYFSHCFLFVSFRFFFFWPLFFVSQFTGTHCKIRYFSAFSGCLLFEFCKVRQHTHKKEKSTLFCAVELLQCRLVQKDNAIAERTPALFCIGELSRYRQIPYRW